MKDDGFIFRVLSMSVGATVFIAWILVALGRYYEVASFGVGAGISVAMLWTAQYAVVKATTPGRLQGRWFGAALAVTKYGVAAWVIWVFVRWPHAVVLAFAAGVAVTQVVLTLKALGQMISSAQARGHNGETLPGPGHKTSR